MQNFVPRDLPHAKLICVPPHLMGDLLPIALPMIDRAYVEVGLNLPEWLVGDLEKGHALLWLAVDGEGLIMGTLVTALVKRPVGLVCRMMACSGERLQIWREFHLEIERYAKGEGCVKVELEGRPGWARALSGYQRTRVVLEKDLSDGQ